MYMNYISEKLGEGVAATVRWLMQDSLRIFPDSVGFEPSYLPPSYCLHTWTLLLWRVFWT